MAIDTREKRQSAVSFLIPSMIPGVDPSSLDQAGRQASVWSYSGILASSSVSVSALIDLLFNLFIQRTLDRDGSIQRNLIKSTSIDRAVSFDGDLS